MSARLRHGWLVLALLTPHLTLPTAHAYCPSYTRASASNDHHCAVDAAPGINPTQSEWNQLFERVGWGPSVWGAGGVSIAPLAKGCTAPSKVAATFPCELLKGLGMIESSWQQFCKPSKPADQVGRPSQTIVSFDCGYGVMQVTSGMRDFDAKDAYFDRNRVASDAFYAAATGASILARKWAATRCIGSRDPSVIEHWYYAVWAYNGLSFSNHPANPTFDSERGVYDPAIGGEYPYQEKVFGIIEHPPKDSWRPIALAYPRIEDIGTINSHALPEPTCASPTDCTQTRPTHKSECAPPPAPEAQQPVAQQPANQAPKQPPSAAQATATVPATSAAQPPPIAVATAVAQLPASQAPIVVQKVAADAAPNVASSPTQVPAAKQSAGLGARTATEWAAGFGLLALAVAGAVVRVRAYLRNRSPRA